VTSLLSQCVNGRERGLYLGLQQTYGGVMRVLFPILGGVAMDAAGVGSPFGIAAFLLLGALPLTVGLDAARRSAPAAT
jgi:MFS family permease